MTDRELLQAAAKAAGMRDMRWSYETHDLYDPLEQPWNALEDSGDALDLAVKLQLSVNVEKDDVTAMSESPGLLCRELTGSNPYRATRRAIVRAAAAMAPKTTAEPA